ncbi:hypothetical protein I7I50_01416 [Histoplasma capsulatum G186AR]|uniref:Uncharacterized protein n=1 Tax=Ajellomyces capsulatus TaxID=5037 RepID=A0A8H7YFU4_AJECA|nr:hypothetical protein I7I52_12532 [Histoplasma capsulatum]QSS73300.1 hypothetical protein I7I50_01416 [Histoplasma capsulatum G186AR]
MLMVRGMSDSGPTRGFSEPETNLEKNLPANNFANPHILVLNYLLVGEHISSQQFLHGAVSFRRRYICISKDGDLMREDSPYFEFLNAATTMCRIHRCW